MPLYDISAYARQSQASPSVSIERGSYRMRAPVKRHPATATHIAKTSRDGLPPALRYEKQMALLVMFLVCATVTCFATAYYLFTTRWDAPAHSTTSTLSSDSYSHLQVDVCFDTPGLASQCRENGSLARTGDSEERFLAYLPHSGFHNQRIAFENALVLSRLLNRTLLVPPVRLGKPLFYAPFQVLQEMLVNSSKLELQHCQQYIHRQDLTPLDCADYFQYTDVPWDWLVDLSDIKTQQTLVERQDFTNTWLHDALGLGEDDIFTLWDDDRDTYGFQDFVPFSGTKSRKFKRMVHLSTLARRTEKLIHLGSLFGTSRLHLRAIPNLSLRKEIRAQMARLRPFLGDAADAIQRAIGRDYLGAHVRLGDGNFEEDAEENIRVVWWKLVHGVLGFDIEDAMRIERVLTGDAAGQPPDMPLDWRPLDVSLTLDRDGRAAMSTRSRENASALLCPGTPHRDRDFARLNTYMYVSTDSPDPRSDPRLRPLLQTFPCTFFLRDFGAETAPLAPLRSAQDGVPLKPFVEPLLDAMVVARAAGAVGTEGSTFSRFVEDVLWRVYHGLDIVSKG